MKLAPLQPRLLGEARSRLRSILTVVDSGFGILTESAPLQSALGSPGEDGLLNCAGSRSVESFVLRSTAAAHSEWFREALGSKRRTSSLFPVGCDWQTKSGTPVSRTSCQRDKQFSSFPKQSAERNAEELNDRSSPQDDDGVTQERGPAEARQHLAQFPAEGHGRIEGSLNLHEASADIILQECQLDNRELDPQATKPETRLEEEGSLDGKPQALDAGLLSLAERRQEKDRDPEREYFHVFKLEEIKRILEEVKGRDVEVMYVRERCNFTDYMVVVTGRTERHIRAMAEAVVRELSSRCQEIMEGLTPAVEGEPGQKWLLVDAGNIIVHFFTEEEREHYNLEGLWGGKAPTKRKYGPYGEPLD